MNKFVKAARYVLISRRIKQADHNVYNNYSEFKNQTKPLESGDSIKAPYGDKTVTNHYYSDDNKILPGNSNLKDLNDAQERIHKWAPHAPVPNTDLQSLDYGTWGEYNTETGNASYDINQPGFHKYVYFHEPAHWPTNKVYIPKSWVTPDRWDMNAGRLLGYPNWLYSVEHPSTANEWGTYFLDKVNNGEDPEEVLKTVGTYTENVDGKPVQKTMPYRTLYSERPYMWETPNGYYGPFGRLNMEKNEPREFSKDSWMGYTHPTLEAWNPRKILKDQLNSQYENTEKLGEIFNYDSSDAPKALAFLGKYGLVEGKPEVYHKVRELIKEHPSKWWYNSSLDDRKDLLEQVYGKAINDKEVNPYHIQKLIDWKKDTMEADYSHIGMLYKKPWLYDELAKSGLKADLNDPNLQLALALYSNYPEYETEEGRKKTGISPEVWKARDVGMKLYNEKLEQLKAPHDFLGNMGLLYHLNRGINVDDNGNPTPVGILQGISQQLNPKTAKTYTELYDKIKARLKNYKKNPQYLHVMRWNELSPEGDSPVGANAPTLTIEKMRKILKQFDEADRYQELENLPQFQGYSTTTNT